MSLALLRSSPPALIPYKTCVYKHINHTELKVDVYLPTTPDAGPHAVALYIPGGGWISVNRTDYSRPLFSNLLYSGFLVCCINYRVLPETPFAELAKDVEDIETWIRECLPKEIEKEDLKVDCNKLVVLGGSAGGHLALLTPKIWKRPPIAILALYPPTNMENLLFLDIGRLSRDELKISECTSEFLASATYYEHPPSEFPTLQNLPRRFLFPNVLRKGVLVDFLLNGLVGSKEEGWKLPEKGSASKEQIRDISPYHICTEITYPPTCLVMGTGDEVFDISHMAKFKFELNRKNVPLLMIEAPGEGHAFDIWASVGDELDMQYLQPAVKWISRQVLRESL